MRVHKIMHTVALSFKLTSDMIKKSGFIIPSWYNPFVWFKFQSNKGIIPNKGIDQRRLLFTLRERVFKSVEMNGMVISKPYKKRLDHSRVLNRLSRDSLKPTKGSQEALKPIQGFYIPSLGSSTILGSTSPLSPFSNHRGNENKKGFLPTPGYVPPLRLHSERDNNKKPANRGPNPFRPIRIRKIASPSNLCLIPSVCITTPYLKKTGDYSFKGKAYEEKPNKSSREPSVSSPTVFSLSKRDTLDNTYRHKKIRGLLGVVRINSTKNNTIVTLVDGKGYTKGWACAGSLGFKNNRKSTTYAAQAVSDSIVKKAKREGYTHLRVFVKGLGRGKQSSLRAVCKSGLKIISLQDNTGNPHNGCRPCKKRRV